MSRVLPRLVSVTVALAWFAKVNALSTVSTIQQHCYKGLGIEPLVFVGPFKSGPYGDDIARQYNSLDPVTKLVEVPCDEIVGEYTLVHYTYFPKLVESWLAEIDTQPRAICMDNSYEPGFKNLVNTDVSPISSTIIYTGMDRSKADSTPDAQFRSYDLCMTMTMNRFRDRHALAIDQTRKGAEAADQERDYRFVVLVNKRKGWRIWFVARLHEYGILPRTLYTLTESPHPCFYHSKTHDINDEECKGVPKVSKAAIQFSREVKPRVLNGIQTGVERELLSEFDMKAMIPRGRVHIILESEPTSLREGHVLCHWNERVTEKTWEALSFGHAFVLVGTFLSLDLIKAHGFKTFSPCINETYAGIWDEDLKLQAALVEIHRLHALPDAEYDHLFATCIRPRAQYNYDLFHSVEFRRKQAQQRLWAWGIADTPGFDMENFRAKCDNVALTKNNQSLSQCRA